MAAVQLVEIIVFCLFTSSMNVGISKFLRRQGFRLTMLQRMTTGFLFAGFAMIAAGLVEYHRKKASVSNDIKSTCDDTIYINDISVVWQIPAFSLIGIGDGLVSVSSCEFFNSQAPQHMKSIIMALFLVACGIGSFMIGFLVVLANCDSKNPWITNNLNDGHLDWYFFCVGVGMFAFSLCSIVSAVKYHYVHLS